MVSNTSPLRPRGLLRHTPHAQAHGAQAALPTAPRYITGSIQPDNSSAWYSLDVVCGMGWRVGPSGCWYAVHTSFHEHSVILYVGVSSSLVPVSDRSLCNFQTPRAMHDTIKDQVSTFISITCDLSSYLANVTLWNLIPFWYVPFNNKEFILRKIFSVPTGHASFTKKNVLCVKSLYINIINELEEYFYKHLLWIIVIKQYALQ